MNSSYNSSLKTFTFNGLKNLLETNADTSDLYSNSCSLNEKLCEQEQLITELVLERKKSDINFKKLCKNLNHIYMSSNYINNDTILLLFENIALMESNKIFLDSLINSLKKTRY